MIKDKSIILLLLIIVFYPLVSLANNDFDTFISKEDSEAIMYAWSLPKERQIELARLLLQHENGRIVYRGSQLLIKNGMEGETFAPLARIIVEGKSKTDLKGRLGYDWQHSDDATLFLRMMLGIMQSMHKNYAHYDASQQQIALRVFKKMGYKGAYNRKKIETFLQSFRDKIKN